MLDHRIGRLLSGGKREGEEGGGRERKGRVEEREGGRERGRVEERDGRREEREGEWRGGEGVGGRRDIYMQCRRSEKEGGREGRGGDKRRKRRKEERTTHMQTVERRYLYFNSNQLVLVTMHYLD